MPSGCRLAAERSVGAQCRAVDGAGHPAIEFLRPGGLEIARSQTGLDVYDGQMPIKGSNRGGHHGGGIALYDDTVGLVFLQDSSIAVHATGRQRSQR